MSGARPLNPRPAVGSRPGPTPQRSSPDQLPPIRRGVVRRQPAQTPPTPRAPAAHKATNPPAASKLVKPPVSSGTPPPQEANNQTQLPDSTPVESNEEETEEKLPEKTELDNCAICLDACTEPKKLDKCGHIFCTDCIDHYFNTVKPQCPCCFTIYGEIRGNQPKDGTMNYTVGHRRLPGFGRTSTGTITITYHFPNGTQDANHPNPGMPYYGTSREAYLPDNSEGRHVLELLERAFSLRQTFTIGQSRTTGCDNVVTWNDIHHKTSPTGGMQNFGYPDQTYLSRVQQELAAKGII